jgi:hypothetical protein
MMIATLQPPHTASATTTATATISSSSERFVFLSQLSWWQLSFDVVGVVGERQQRWPQGR